MSNDFPAAMSHGELEEVFPDVFWLQGTVRMGPGMVINRVMVVLRHEGDLTVVNGIRPEDPGIFDGVGAVRHIVRIGGHGMDDPWYKSHFGAKHWANGERCAPAVPDEELKAGSELPVPWAKLHAFEDCLVPELYMVLDRAEGVLVTCDCVQNWPDAERCSLIAKGVTRLMGFQARPAQIGPPWRKKFTPEGGSLKSDFDRMASLPFDHLIGGHGKPLIGGAKAALQASIKANYPE